MHFSTYDLCSSIQITSENMLFSTFSHEGDDSVWNRWRVYHTRSWRQGQGQPPYYQPLSLSLLPLTKFALHL